MLFLCVLVLDSAQCLPAGLDCDLPRYFLKHVRVNMLDFTGDNVTFLSQFFHLGSIFERSLDVAVMC